MISGNCKEGYYDAKAKGVNLLIPTDTIIADAFSNDANQKTVKTDQIPTAGWVWTLVRKPLLSSRK